MRVSNGLAALFAGLTLSACVNDPQVTATTTLLGHEWLVEDIAAGGVIDYARTTIEFGADGRVSGDTGCNRYFASFQTEGAKLQISDAGATRRACPPAVMDQETRFLKVLGEVERYEIDETNMLLLTTPAGVSLKAR